MKNIFTRKNKNVCMRNTYKNMLFFAIIAGSVLFAACPDPGSSTGSSSSSSESGLGSSPSPSPSPTTTIDGVLSYYDVRAIEGSDTLSTSPKWNEKTIDGTVSYSLTQEDGSALTEAISGVVAIDASTGVITVSTGATLAQTSLSVTATGTGSYGGSVSTGIDIAVEPTGTTDTFDGDLTYIAVTTVAGEKTEVPTAGFIGTDKIGQEISSTYSIAVKPGAGVSALGDAEDAFVSIDDVTGTIVISDTAPVSTGTYIVTATGKGVYAGEFTTADVSITVLADPTAPPAVNSVSIDGTGPYEVTIGGATLDLTATVEAVGGAAETVTWESNDTAIATVEADGKVTGVAAGTAMIIATSTEDSTKYATVSVTVKGICEKTYNPSDKAALIANIDTLYNQCGGNSADYNNIDVSAVADMSELFKDNIDFNGDISGWDMSGVTNVNSMFEGATAFDQDLSSWVLEANAVVKDSATPTKMFYKSGMSPKHLPNNLDTESNFYQYAPADKNELKTAITTEIAKQGDEADLSIIDTSQLTEMVQLFRTFDTFNGYIATWDISKVEDMSAMFFNSKAFNQPIGKWDTSTVQNMSTMFAYTEVFNQPLKDWDTSSVTNMSHMFAETKAFNQPIGEWKTDSVINMSSMFYDAVAFNQPLKDWNTSKVESMMNMFVLATSFDQNLKTWSNEADPNTSAMFFKSGMSTDNKATWMP